MNWLSPKNSANQGLRFEVHSARHDTPDRRNQLAVSTEHGPGLLAHHERTPQS